jgi:putative holliday junction resolvase
MKRVLGIDFGTKRLGFALGDPLTGVAVPLDSVELNGADPVKFVWGMIERDGYDHVVVGTPLSVDGEATSMSGRVEKFAETLRQVAKIDVTLINEHLTSKVADMIAKESGLKRHDDAIAAMLITQEFINENRKEDLGFRT